MHATIGTLAELVAGACELWVQPLCSVVAWHVLVCAFLTPFVCAVHATDKSDGGPSKTPKTQPPKTAEGGPNMYQEPPFTGDDATGRHRGNRPIQYKNDAMAGKRKHN